MSLLLVALLLAFVFTAQASLSEDLLNIQETINAGSQSDATSFRHVLQNLTMIEGKLETILADVSNDVSSSDSTQHTKLDEILQRLSSLQTVALDTNEIVHEIAAKEDYADKFDRMIKYLEVVMLAIEGKIGGSFFPTLSPTFKPTLNPSKAPATNVVNGIEIGDGFLSTIGEERKAMLELNVSDGDMHVLYVNASSSNPGTVYFDDGRGCMSPPHRVVPKPAYRFGNLTLEGKYDIDWEFDINVFKGAIMCDVHFSERPGNYGKFMNIIANTLGYSKHVRHATSMQLKINAAICCSCYQTEFIEGVCEGIVKVNKGD